MSGLDIRILIPNFYDSKQNIPLVLWNWTLGYMICFCDCNSFFYFFLFWNCLCADTLCVCSKESTETVDLDWDNLGFGLVPTDYMYMMKCTQDGIFTEGELLRYGPIELSPSSGVLNYGQVSIELKFMVCCI